jgi:GT2 family glycosyltransferase
LAARLAAHARVPNAAVIGPLRLPEELRVGRRREPFELARGVLGRALWINATGANTSFPTEAFRRVGGYDASFRQYGGEDPDLALRLRERGVRFRFEPGAACLHHGRMLGAGDAKPELAGRAHWRVYERHRRLDVGLLLGVHPALLRLKRGWYAGPLAGLVPAETRSYELAYLRGAEGARREAEGVPDAHAGEERP